MTTKFKKSFSPMLICWNDIKIHLGFEDSYFVPPPTISKWRKSELWSKAVSDAGEGLEEEEDGDGEEVEQRL